MKMDQQEIKKEDKWQDHSHLISNAEADRKIADKFLTLDQSWANNKLAKAIWEMYADDKDADWRQKTTRILKRFANFSSVQGWERLRDLRMSLKSENLLETVNEDGSCFWRSICILYGMQPDQWREVKFRYCDWA